MHIIFENAHKILFVNIRLSTIFILSLPFYGALTDNKPLINYKAIPYLYIYFSHYLKYHLFPEILQNSFQVHLFNLFLPR